MDATYWQKQTSDKPLFEDLLWSRPQNRRQAGKLLIIGGNSHSFAAVSRSYGAAEKIGIGVARVVLPNALQKPLGKSFPEAEFAASTPSGSFSREALAHLLELASWSDGVLLAGDFGRNSETAVLLDNFTSKYDGPLTVAGDTLDYFISSNNQLLNRPDTTLILEFSKLQKLGASAGVALAHNMSLMKLAETLNEWSANAKIAFVTGHENQILAALDGQISTTPGQLLADLAAYVGVWRLQQPSRPFEALTTAIYSAVND